ncbi:MAG: hypothetical protein LBT06_12895 [Hungatella sp.]|jgi:hypothetical protein|nr:hypothetical protein [Hungatella sp.]
MMKGIKLLSMCVTAVIVSSIIWFVRYSRINRIYYKTCLNNENTGDSHGTEA